MAARVIVGVVALACVATCGIVATLANLEMVDKVNDKLPKGEQFEALGWYLSKSWRLHREYTRLYSDGRLLLMVRILARLRLGFGLLGQ
ncbi:MAG: hypothetical protein ACLPWF_02565 [Bryobacteraceae bacterium]